MKTKRHSQLLWTATIRMLVALLTGLLLAGCPGPQRPTPSTPSSQPALKPVPGAQALNIVPAESLVRILVYRGGALAQMGHNHVIASHEVHGKIYLHPEFKRSAFEVIMPVQSLKVDEAALRQQEGKDFPPEVPESAKEGTRNNMLSEALLDAEHYPEIRLLSRTIEGTEEQFTVLVRIGVKNQWHELTVPMKLAKQTNGLTASGEFKLTHTALGLQPFTAALGALKVQDEMTVKFSIVAR